jgi:hypothetical protein
MRESPAFPDPDTNEGDEPRRQPGGQSPPRTPRWVVVLGIIGLVLILAVIVQLVFGIRHGPGLHSLTVEAPAELLTHLR